MLRYRLMLGPLLAALMVGLVWLDTAVDAWALPGWAAGWMGRATFPPGVVIFLLVASASGLAGWELARILKDNGIGTTAWLTSGAAVLGLIMTALVPRQEDAVQATAIAGSIATVVFLAAMAAYARRKTFEGVVAAVGGTLLAYVYLGLMMGFWMLMRREYSAWTLLWVLATTKACDIGAFAVGKAVGRHKLIQWLSPGKTWEGLLGGVALGGVAGGVGMLLLKGHPGAPDGGWAMGVAAGLVFAVVGQVGDLLASMLKRDAGRKDASRMLPGFGGVLDVVDSPLLVAPVAFWWLAVFG